MAGRRGLHLFQRRGMLAWIDAMEEAKPESTARPAAPAEPSTPIFPRMQMDIAAVLADVALKNVCSVGGLAL